MSQEKRESPPWAHMAHMASLLTTAKSSYTKPGSMQLSHDFGQSSATVVLVGIEASSVEKSVEHSICESKPAASAGPCRGARRRAR